MISFVFIRSLAPLFDNHRLDKELFAMLRENFTEFCTTESSKQIQKIQINRQPSKPTDEFDFVMSPLTVGLCTDACS